MRCKNCGEPIAYDEVFHDWYHTDKHDAPRDMECHASEDKFEKSWAEPSEEAPHPGG